MPAMSSAATAAPSSSVWITLISRTTSTKLVTAIVVARRRRLREARENAVRKRETRAGRGARQ